MAGAGRDDVIYLDEPWVSIRWDAIHKYVFSEWKAFANSEEFRAALMRALDAIRDHQAVVYLSDTRKVKVVVHKDQDWANQVWFPLLAATGVKRFALVTADSGLGKATVEDVVERVDNEGLLVRHFESIPAARAWLAEITEGHT